MGDLIKYTASDGGLVEIKSFELARDMLVSGKRHAVTEAELIVKLETCKGRGLNPLTGDVCLIKYSESEPLQLIETRQYARKVAMAHPTYQGHQTGIIVSNQKGDIMNLPGSFLPPNHKLLGAWFRARPKGWNEDKYITIGLPGNIKRTRSGEVTNFWREENQPFMIEKVVEAQGLRAAFPRTSWLPTEEEHTYARAAGMAPDEYGDMADDAPEPGTIDAMTQEQLTDLLSRVDKEHWPSLEDFLFQRGSLEGTTLSSMSGLVAGHILENWNNGVQLEFQDYLKTLKTATPEHDRYEAFRQDLLEAGYSLPLNVAPSTEQELEQKQALMEKIKGVWKKNGLDPAKTKAWMAEKTKTFDGKIPKNEHGHYSLSECALDVLQEMDDTTNTWLSYAKSNPDLKLEKKTKGKKAKK